MTDGLTDIIAHLKRQKAGIERALAALREVEGNEEAPGMAASVPDGPPIRKGGMTLEGRRRLSEALRKRWAAKKAAEGSPPADRQKTARRKVRITPEGRKRLAEAMRRRWAAKRTAAQAKKRGRKKA